MYNVQCTMYNVQCTVYNVQCTMYYVHTVNDRGKIWPGPGTEHLLRGRDHHILAPGIHGAGNLGRFLSTY